MADVIDIKWDLKKLYASPESDELVKDIEYVKEHSKKLSEKFGGRVSELSTEELLELFRESERVYETTWKLMLYSYLFLSEDTSNSAARKLFSRLQDVDSEVENNFVPLKLELAKMPDEIFEKLFKMPQLKKYAHFVQKHREARKYFLSEAEERLINIKNITGKEAFSKLYTEFTSSFRYEMEVDGEKRLLTRSEVDALRRHSNPEIREQAFRVLFTKPKENEIVITNIYNSIVKDWVMESKKRNYPSSISSRNVSNEISDEAVNSLIEVTTENNKLVHEYYRLKAWMMKRDKLKHSDIYAPLEVKEKKYTWEEAKELVLQVMREFDPKVEEIIREFFEGEYIHAPVLPNKRAGAFCYSIPNVHPYVLVNFTGKQDDVLTLAHELGHGLHGVLSQKQNLFNYRTPLTMAEVASVFSEMLMIDYLLRNMTDKEEKIAFIASQLEGMFATMNRQNMLTRFELKAHEKIEKQYQTFDELSDIYLEELKNMFGDSIDYFDFSGYEWAVIPHIFHTPFYCYAYDFAQLMVIALYEKYLEEGETFKKKYIELLSSGGSDKPEKLLKKVGVDLSDPAFWQKGFDFINRRFLKELKNLVS